MLRDRGPVSWSELTSSVAPIRTVMRGTVVQAETRRETNPAFQPVLFHESSSAIFDVLSDLNHRLPWLDELARGLSNLFVYLCSPTDVVVSDFWIFHGHALVVALLF
jgi:hypothetical protein